MTRTIVASATREIVIGFDQPFCVIGERINPTGRKKLAAEMVAGNFETVIKDALEQAAGAGPFHFRNALGGLATYVRAGHPLAEGMRGYGGLFHPVIPAIGTGSPALRVKRSDEFCSTRAVWPAGRYNSGPDAGTEAAMNSAPFASRTIQPIST